MKIKYSKNVFNITVLSRGAYGSIWSDLTLKSDQTKNSDMKIFQAGLDRLNRQIGLYQTILQGFVLVWSTSFYF